MNYRYIIFDYIGDLIRSNTTVQTNTKTTSRQEFSISGRKGRFMYFPWLLFSFFAIIFSQVEKADNIKFFNNVYVNLGLITITMLVVLLRRYLLYKRLEPKPISINLYSRELPSRLRPAHMRLLIEDGTIDGVSLGSTIMDLVDRDYLEYIKDKNVDDKLIFFHDNKTRLVKTNKSHDDLLKYEKFIIDWFINGYGDGESVSALEVNKGLKRKILKGDMEAADMFLEWQALVLMSFPMDKYYKRLYKNYYKRLIYFILAIIGFFSILTTPGALLMIYGFGMLFLASPLRIITQEGIDEINGWLTLKRFLNDFGDMENKTAEMVNIWDFYLTYSIALDMSKKASKEMETFFGRNIYVGATEIHGKIPYDCESIKKEIEEEYKKL